MLGSRSDRAIAVAEALTRHDRFDAEAQFAVSRGDRGRGRMLASCGPTRPSRMEGEMLRCTPASSSFRSRLRRSERRPTHAITRDHGGPTRVRMETFYNPRTALFAVLNVLVMRRRFRVVVDELLAGLVQFAARRDAHKVAGAVVTAPASARARRGRRHGRKLTGHTSRPSRHTRRRHNTGGAHRPHRAFLAAEVSETSCPAKRLLAQCLLGLFGMNDLQIEDLLERVEIAIAVEQRMRVLETERRDEAVDRLPHRPSASAQTAIVSRSRLRERDAASLEDLKTA